MRKFSAKAFSLFGPFTYVHCETKQLKKKKKSITFAQIRTNRCGSALRHYYHSNLL